MARGGMRIGEVLKLRVRNVDGCILLIEQPKSGRQSEVVFIPKKVAERLREYIRSKSMEPDHRIFPVGYTGQGPQSRKPDCLSVLISIRITYAVMQQPMLPDQALLLKL